MSGPRGSRREPSVTFLLINAFVVGAGAAIAAWAMAPVYSSSRFTWAAVFAIVAGISIAVVCERLRWGPARAAVLVSIAFVIGGLTLAIPSVLSGGTAPSQAIVELLQGPVMGWKDIVTLPLPLGEYRATLVPVFALLLVGTTLAMWAAARAKRWWPLTAVVVVAMVVVAVVIGPSTRALPLTLAPYGEYVSREFLVGLAVFGLLLTWFVWRAAYARRRAIVRSDNAARLTAAPRTRALGIAAAGVLLVLVAVTVASVVAGPVAAQTPREVARTVIDPRMVVDTSLSPLSGYRNYFSDAAYTEVLFTVTVTEGSVDRVRIATLPYFDGNEFTAATPPSTEATLFQHVPSAIPPASGMQRVRADVTIEAHSGMWIPLVGALGEVQFNGARQPQMVDGFYYQADDVTAIMVTGTGLVESDSYSMTAYVPSEAATVAELGPPPGISSVPTDLIPASLTEWVLRQGVPRDGAGLAILVERLRARGYLSHALSVPEGAPTPVWQGDLPGYSFAASAAGHSYDRIDSLFTALVTREAEAEDNSSLPLVSAIGDDEQFATAVALLAAELGFPSRVVLGTRLTAPDAPGFSIPACNEGVCSGRNVTVWTEVQGSDGTWVAVDVTPQHSNPPAPDDTRLRDPEFATDLDPQRAEQISPPSSQRGSSAVEEPAPLADAGIWEWLGPVLRIGGTALAVIALLLGPFIVILAWKAARRRRRRRADPDAAIHHGWDEYLDTAIDAGLMPLPASTRMETAHEYASPNGVALAQVTDRTTFSTTGASAADAAAFWDLVEADRAAWLHARSRWSRLRMRLSLRSVWHSVVTQTPGAPAPTVAAPASEAKD